MPVAAALFVSVVAGAQKPVVEEPLFVDGSGPPATLAAMVKGADAVVVATYQRQARLVPGRREGDLIFSIHAFEIVEVLKFSAAVGTSGDTLEVGFVGGVAEYRDRIVRQYTRGVSPLVPHRTYLIFLRWVPGRAEGDLVPAWSVGGIFDISEGRVQSLDEHGRRFENRGTASFVGDIRKAR